MARTRRYSIEIKDVTAGKTLLYTAVDLTKAEVKAVIERNMRLAGRDKRSDGSAADGDDDGL